MTYNKKQVLYIFLALLLMLVVLSACGMNSNASGTPAPGTPGADIPAVLSGGDVVAEGKVVPVHYAKLSFTKGGIVTEILVEEGAQVKEGDVIARLQDSETLRSQVAQSEESVLIAEQSIKDLNDNAKVEESKAFSSISTSYDALREAGRQLYYFNLPNSQRNLEMFEAADVMRDRLAEARKAWEPYKYENEQFGAATERTKLKKALDDAESDYRTALLRISYASKENSALADLEKARSDYEKLQKGPDADKLAAAEAKLQSAQASLTSAKAALDDLEVKAPFNGTIAKVDVKDGENVTAGNPVITIADHSRLVVETDNLTEIEVVKIEKGQEVSIVPDALPDVTLKGKVESIAEVFEEKRGDVTYTVTVELLDSDAKLRWGMTVNSTFKSKE